MSLTKCLKKNEKGIRSLHTHIYIYKHIVYKKAYTIMHLIFVKLVKQFMTIVFSKNVIGQIDF